MKKQIFGSIFFAIIFFFGTFSPAFASLQTVPSVNTPFDQRDLYQTDLFTGSANYSYPIKIPQGTNNLTPDVSLSYSSLGVRDFSISAGAGWQVNRDYIERDVNYTPDDVNDDKFRLHFKGANYELVYVASEDRYHTKTESFLNIQKLSGAPNYTGEYWQVISKDGTKYRFGYTANAGGVCNGKEYIGKWNVDQVEDIHTNHIYYTYTGNSDITYLSKIEYNNDKQRVIDFTYGDNTFQRPIHLQGCSISENFQLTNIQISAAGNTVRQYSFSYIQQAAGQSLLQSITEKGSDGSSLPPTKFDYKPTIKTWQTDPQKWIDNVDVGAWLQNNDTRLLDINDNGLPNIIKNITTNK